VIEDVARKTREVPVLRKFRNHAEGVSKDPDPRPEKDPPLQGVQEEVYGWT